MTGTGLIWIREIIRDKDGRAIDQDSDAEERIDEWTGIKKIGLHGSSLTVAITEGCRLMGLGRGDVVEVTIRRKN